MWSEANRLAEAARSTEGRWNCLRDALRGLDWLTPSAPAEAARLAVEAAADLLAFGRRLADRMGLPVATVLRNLAVLAPATALPLHRLAWHAGRADPPAAAGL
jgi:hypothetical protein